MCRHVLFTISQVTPIALRTATTRALRASGLGAPFPSHSSFSIVGIFHPRIPLTRSILPQTTMRALQVLINADLASIAGTLRFCLPSLGTTLIAMANLLSHMAMQRGRVYPAG
jgi:hypothetical protein